MTGHDETGAHRAPVVSINPLALGEPTAGVIVATPPEDDRGWCVAMVNPENPEIPVSLATLAAMHSYLTDQLDAQLREHLRAQGVIDKLWRDLHDAA